jgi:hypothetical protein
VIHELFEDGSSTLQVTKLPTNRKGYGGKQSGGAKEKHGHLRSAGLMTYLK